MLLFWSVMPPGFIIDAQVRNPSAITGWFRKVPALRH